MKINVVFYLVNLQRGFGTGVADACVKLFLAGYPSERTNRVIRNTFCTRYWL